MTAVALVTGAAGGIGSAVVAALVRRGWLVVGVDVAPPPEGVVEWVEGDVRDEAVRRRAVDVAGRVGELRGFVTAVLAEGRGLLGELDRRALGEVLEVQVAAALEWGSAVASAADGELSIVHVSSVHAQRAKPGMAAYAMGKAALDALVRATAVEWGPRGVRCNAVLPGFVPVERNRERWSAGADELLANHPLRRFVSADDVAQVVSFLLGPESRAVTGVSLPVDGGMLAQLPHWA
ncbi:SDR family NAD(P)-dependent oxidoreductase [Kribbella sp. WER1]